MILITAPHASCSDDPIRDCDRKAKKAAEILHSLLPNSILLINEDIPRREQDLNRTPTFPTTFNRRFHSLLEDASYVLDIHSFPETTGDHVYMLDRPPFFSSPAPRPFPIYDASAVNYIIVEAKKKNIPAILIEFWEELEEEELRAACEKIKRWLSPQIDWDSLLSDTPQSQSIGSDPPLRR